MVFGLFEGNKINVVLDKPSYSLGEPVTGKLILELKKPKKARGVRVSIYFEYETQKTVVRNRGNPPRQTTVVEHDTERTGVQSVLLDGEKEYSPGMMEYPFSIPTVKTTLMPVGYVKLNGWFIDASLDVPMGVDVGKKIRLNLM